MFPHPPPDMRAALDQLAGRHPELARIEALAGPLPWRERPAGFPGLLHAIAAQQISVAAAAAIWGRLAAVPGALDPAGLLACDPEALRMAGLSRPKVEHARALAEAFRLGRLSAGGLAAMDDAAATAAIVSVRGMGRWSAEVYLLFALGRPDVFPSGDLALAASLARLDGLVTRPTPATLAAMAVRWRPWRGLAARLLFHHWRHVTGRPALDTVSTHSSSCSEAGD